MVAQDPEKLSQDAAVALHRLLCANFERLLELDTEGREREICALQDTEPELARELRAMLAASAGPGLEPDPLKEGTLPADLGADRGYRVLRELGRGGMGRVLLAERSDGRFARKVALKILDHSVHDPDWRRRFEAEREILARLDHPNIVGLLDAGETSSGVPFLVMDYVEGQTLDGWLVRQKPALDQRLRLFTQLATAVAHAHSQLIAHRDLKPGNVLVSADGNVHLLDFGIARLLSEASVTATSARALTPRYAAPEQVSGKPGGASLDIYQLGILLYELLCGEAPFAHLNGPALLQAVLDTDPPPPGKVARLRQFIDARRIDADLDAICLRALRKEPQQR